MTDETPLTPHTASRAALSGDALFWIDTRGGPRPSLWTGTADGGAARQLFGGADAVTGFRAFAKGRSVVVATDCGGDEHHQLRLLDVESGHIRHLKSDPFVINDLGAVSPDDTRLAFAANRRDRGTFDIAIVALATGQRRDLRVGQGWWKVECWETNETLIVSHQRSAVDIGLFRLDLASGECTPLLPLGPARFSDLRQTPQGLLLLTDWGGDHMRLMRVTDGVLTPVHAVAGHDINAYVPLGHDGRIAVLVNEEIGHSLHVGGGDAAWREVCAADGPLSDLRADGTGAVLVTAQSSLRPAQVRRIDLDTDVATALVSPASKPQTGIASVTAIRATAPDGERVPALLYRPHRPNGAAVMIVHGGPESQWLPTCAPQVAALCALGCTVIAPNVRGSSGFGPRWLSLDDRTQRGDVLGDMLCLHDALVAEHGIDPARIGIMGQSYGGYMTALALGLARERWAAAAILYGFADFAHVIGGFGAWRRAHRVAEYGDPDDPVTRQVLDRISPLPHLDKVTVPVFLYHGRRDVRVPIDNTDLIEARLRAGLAPVTRMTVDDEGHGYVGADTRSALWTAIVAHFADALRLDGVVTDSD